MTSELVIFRAFLFIFFAPHLKSKKKNPVNQLIKISGLCLKSFMIVYIKSLVIIIFFLPLYRYKM